MLSVHVRPTLRERNEREGTPSSEFEAALGFSGSGIAEQAPGCRSVPLSASRHWISVRKLFFTGAKKTLAPVSNHFSSNSVRTVVKMMTRLLLLY